MAVSFAIFLLTGCIREDVSECPPNTSEVVVTFRYVLNERGEDLFAREVPKVTLLVFDAQGIYRRAYTDQGTALTIPGYAMHLMLDEGSYTLLALGGLMDTYDVTGLNEGVSTLADFRLQANGHTVRSAGARDISALNDLFHGIYSKLEVKAGQTTRAEMDLTKDTHTLLVNVSGLEHLYAELPSGSTSSPFDVEVLAENGLYGFENLPLEGGYTNCYLPGVNTYTDYLLSASTRVLRLMMGAQMRLKITLHPTGQVICNDDVIELISRNPDYTTQSDMDRQEVFRLNYIIDESSRLSLQVNGWTVIDAIPILE